VTDHASDRRVTDRQTSRVTPPFPLSRLALAGAAAVFVLSACDSAPERPTAAAASPTSTQTAATSPTYTHPADPAGYKACADIKRANAGNVYEHDLDALIAIGTTATESTELSVRIPGQLLVEHAKIAKAAKGQGDEATTRIEVGTAALNLETACIRYGYYR
jgi:hypothetical protein